MIVAFTVLGRAVPVGSKKLVPTGKRPAPGERDLREKILAAANKHEGPWRTKIRRAAKAEARDRPPLVGPLKVTVRSYFERPKFHFDRAGIVRGDAPMFPADEGGPDLDKLARGAFDEMKKAGLIADDGLFVAAHLFKSYALPGENERMHVTVETVG